MVHRQKATSASDSTVLFPDSSMLTEELVTVLISDLAHTAPVKV
jgi:hypothetical protein